MIDIPFWPRPIGERPPFVIIVTPIGACVFNCICQIVNPSDGGAFQPPISRGECVRRSQQGTWKSLIKAHLKTFKRLRIVTSRRAHDLQTITIHFLCVFISRFIIIIIDTMPFVLTVAINSLRSDDDACAADTKAFDEISIRDGSWEKKRRNKQIYPAWQIGM